MTIYHINTRNWHCLYIIAHLYVKLLIILDKLMHVLHSVIQTLYGILKLKTPNTTNKYAKIGLYKLTFSRCKRSYVGLSSHNLKQRYQEHVTYIINIDPQLANNVREYATHFTNTYIWLSIASRLNMTYNQV
jgi:hypothetical protein